MNPQAITHQMYLDLKNGSLIEIGVNDTAKVLKYITEELKRLTELHLNIIAHNPQMKDYPIEKIDEYKHLIRVKNMLEPDIKKYSEPTKHEFASIVRVRAFFIMLMYESGQVTKEVMESKKQIFELTKKLFPEASEKTVYSALKVDGIFLNFDNLIVKYKSDFDYSLKLYKEKFPD